jgi:hypothetical protein
MLDITGCDIYMRTHQVYRFSGADTLNKHLIFSLLIFNLRTRGKKRINFTLGLQTRHLGRFHFTNLLRLHTQTKWKWKALLQDGFKHIR